jgi:hypothetical protein
MVVDLMLRSKGISIFHQTSGSVVKTFLGMTADSGTRYIVDIDVSRMTGPNSPGQCRVEVSVGKFQKVAGQRGWRPAPPDPLIAGLSQQIYNQIQTVGVRYEP